ncbi:MAG TPA: DUF4395 family protein [Thermoleophilaceae bacterium]|nr:DUF4395 family protein [Thermoleophilaceae bacterium]
MSRATDWMDANLATQGYCLTASQNRELWLGLRFSTGVCLALTTGALIVGAPALFVALALVGAIAGFGPRHPFDYLWNGGVRHLLGAPPVPPSPERRRHAFKVATVWMLVLAGLFAIGADTAAVVAGVLLLGACTAVTVAQLCIPSLIIAWFDRRREAVPAAR